MADCRAVIDDDWDTVVEEDDCGEDTPDEDTDEEVEDCRDRSNRASCESQLLRFPSPPRESPLVLRARAASPRAPTPLPTLASPAKDGGHWLRVSFDSALGGTEIGACLELCEVLVAWLARRAFGRRWRTGLVLVLAALVMVAGFVAMRAPAASDDADAAPEASCRGAAAESIADTFWHGPTVQA